jgi:hypothetical protein
VRKNGYQPTAHCARARHPSGHPSAGLTKLFFWYRDVRGLLFAPLIAAFLLALPRTTLERGVWSPPSQATFIGLASTVLCWVLRLPLLAIGIALLYAPFLAVWTQRERQVRR